MDNNVAFLSLCLYHRIDDGNWWTRPIASCSIPQHVWNTPLIFKSLAQSLVQVTERRGVRSSEWRQNINNYGESLQVKEDVEKQHIMWSNYLHFDSPQLLHFIAIDLTTVWDLLGCCQPVCAADNLLSPQLQIDVFIAWFLYALISFYCNSNGPRFQLRTYRKYVCVRLKAATWLKSPSSAVRGLLNVRQSHLVVLSCSPICSVIKDSGIYPHCMIRVTSAVAVSMSINLGFCGKHSFQQNMRGARCKSFYHLQVN